MAARLFLVCLCGQLMCGAGAGASAATRSAHLRWHAPVADLPVAASPAARSPANQQGLVKSLRARAASLAQVASARLVGAWAEPEPWEGRRSPSAQEHLDEADGHLGEADGRLGEGHPGLDGKWGVVTEAVAKALSPLPGRQFEDARRYWLLLAVSGVAYVLFATLIAWYHSNFQKPELHEKDYSFGRRDLNQWTSGILDFHAIKAEPWICIWSCCVPCVRWAETMHVSTILPFWTAFGIFVFFQFLQITLPFALTFYCILVIVLTYYRQQFRKEFDMKRDPPTYEHHHFEVPKVAATDCCLYFWCTPCTLAQEARHVETSMKMPALPPSPSPYGQPSPSGRLGM